MTLLPVALLSLATPAAAQHADSGAPHAEHEYHRNHVALFTGWTYNSEESGFTAGGDYEYRFSRRFGIGADGEWVAGTVRESVFVVPVFFHVTHGLRLAGGPGFAHHSAAGESSASEHGAENEANTSTTHPLARITGMYDFSIRRFTITPSISLDFVNGKRMLVYGVSWGFGF